MTCPAVPATVMNTVLKKYLVTGTHELDISTQSSVKFLSVGLLTVKSVGGNLHISLKGLKAVTIANTSGIDVKNAQEKRKMSSNAVPVFERVT